MQNTMCLITCLVLSFAVHGYAAVIPRSCNKTISSVENYAPIPTKLISLRCDTGGLTWNRPQNSHIVAFQKKRKPFFVCLHSESPGTTIYRLKGYSSVQIIAGQNDTGDFGCFESRCLHATFLFVADDDLNLPALKYIYYSALDLRCGICTESCEQQCLCSAPYVFIGKLLRFNYNDGHYTHYFRLAEFIRYDGEYTNQTLQALEQECHSKPKSNRNINNSTPLTPPMITESMSDASTPNEQSPNDRSLSNNIPIAAINQEEVMPATNVIPREGEVKVYSKCPIKVGRVHLISATFHVGRKNKGRLVLCCASDDSYFAQAHLEGMLSRQECCRYL